MQFYRHTIIIIIIITVIVIVRIIFTVVIIVDDVISTMHCRPGRLDKILYVPLPPPEGKGGHPAGPYQEDPSGGGCGCGGCGRQPSLPWLQWSRPGSSGQGSLHLRTQGMPLEQKMYKKRLSPYNTGFLLEFNKKPSIIPGCPGRYALAFKQCSSLCKPMPSSARAPCIGLCC